MVIFAGTEKYAPNNKRLHRTLKRTIPLFYHIFPRILKSGAIAIPTIGNFSYFTL